MLTTLTFVCSLINGTVVDDDRPDRRPKPSVMPIRYTAESVPPVRSDGDEHSRRDQRAQRRASRGDGDRNRQPDDATTRSPTDTRAPTPVSNDAPSRSATGQSSGQVSQPTNTSTLGVDAHRDPVAAQGPAPTSTAVATERKPPPSGHDRYNRWSLNVAPGTEFILFGPLTIYGPTLRVGTWVHKWRGRLMFGGGPALQYTYLVDNVNSGDKIHLATVNGDLVIGGGRADKYALYGHLTFGAGLLAGYDAQTQTRLLLPGLRAAGGIGGHYFFGDAFSVGVLADIGFAGGVALDTFVVAALHFGRRHR